MYRHQSVWVSTIREQYNRSFDHDMYLGLHPYIVLYRYIWVFDGIWEFGHSNRLTFRLHHTPLNTQIIHQPIVSETESLLKEIITIKEFQPTNHTCLLFCCEKLIMHRNWFPSQHPGLGGTAGLCVPLWRRGRSFSHAFKAFLAVWLGPQKILLWISRCVWNGIVRQKSLKNNPGFLKAMDVGERYTVSSIPRGKSPWRKWCSFFFLILELLSLLSQLGALCLPPPASQKHVMMRCLGPWFQPFSLTIWQPMRTWEYLAPQRCSSALALVVSLVLLWVGHLV